MSAELGVCEKYRVRCKSFSEKEEGQEKYKGINVRHKAYQRRLVSFSSSFAQLLVDSARSISCI